jgi:hypothetical protein
MSGFNFGNVEDSQTARTLICNLQTYGKTAIRRGWRKGLPRDKPPVWVFCPLKPHKWRGQVPPKDRGLITNCQGDPIRNIPSCPHFRGIQYSTHPPLADPNERIEAPKPAPHMKKPPVMKVSKAALDELAKAKRKWQAEEGATERSTLSIQSLDRLLFFTRSGTA